MRRVYIIRARKLCLLLSLACSLSGCGWESQFDCPAHQGLSCQSIVEVKSQVEAAKVSVMPFAMESTLSEVFDEAVIQTPPKTRIQLTPEGEMEWVPEVVQSVWMPPYGDDEGQLHSARKVYSVVHRGYWRLKRKS